jgi:thiamine-monophosphate kinase
MSKPIFIASAPNSEITGEFALIESIFKMGALAMAKVHPENAPTLGIGDDCALIQSKNGEVMAITSDLLVAGRHFFIDTDPYRLGKKSLAVNLSDLAAMGANPIGFTLSLALPVIDENWIKAFAQGLFDEAKQYRCHLVGGDTCAGPLTINITAVGNVPSQLSIRRSGAQVNDDIWVSGTVGDARLALAHARKEWALTLSSAEVIKINQRLYEPTPRIELGLALRGIANAAIDISDGLLGDLNHILHASNVNAEVWIDSLPISDVLQHQEELVRRQCAAAGGDDYELCFTADVKHQPKIKMIANELDLPLTRIGQIIQSKKNIGEKVINLFDQQNKPLGAKETDALLRSFDHFKP